MGQSNSSELFIQVLHSSLSLRGVKVETKQLSKFISFIKQICPWFPESGTINIETWRKVGERIQGYYQAHGPEAVPVDTFALWSLIKDCLVTESEADKWRRITRNSLRRSQSLSRLSPASCPLPSPPVMPPALPGNGPPRYEEPIQPSAPLPPDVSDTPSKEALQKVCQTQTYQEFLEALDEVSPPEPMVVKTKVSAPMDDEQLPPPRLGRP